MIKTERIKRENLERGGMNLQYLGDDGVCRATISVDVIGSVIISVGNSYNDFMSFHLVRMNDGYGASGYLEYICNHMDVDSFPDEESMEVCKELLCDKEFCACLDECIENIPRLPSVAANIQIQKARDEYEKICREALDKYQGNLFNIVNAKIAAESLREFASDFGLVNGNDYTKHGRTK